MSDDVSTELDTVIPRHQLLDNTAAKHKTDLIHRWGWETSLTQSLTQCLTQNLTQYLTLIYIQSFTQNLTYKLTQNMSILHICSFDTKVDTEFDTVKVQGTWHRIWHRTWHRTWHRAWHSFPRHQCCQTQDSCHFTGSYLFINLSIYHQSWEWLKFSKYKIMSSVFSFCFLVVSNKSFLESFKKLIKPRRSDFEVF